MPDPLDELLSRLLRAGVAPRIARRTAEELQAHLLDLQAALEAEGLSRKAAHDEAIRRLGNLDLVVECALSDPRARGFAGRFPILAFVMLPVFFTISLWLLVAFGLVQVIHLNNLRDIAVGFGPAVGAIWAIIPLAVASSVTYAATKRLASSCWSAFGVGSVALLASVFSIHIAAPTTIADGQINIALGLPSAMMLFLVGAAAALPLIFNQQKNQQNANSDFSDPNLP